MKQTRFCSHKELQSLLREGTITNNTDHFKGGNGGSTSKGFCLSPDAPEKAWKYLKGIVTPDVCVVYEIPQGKLTTALGKYADHIYKNGRYCPQTYLKEEYNTPLLRKEWIKEIVPLESFIPQYEIEAARYVRILAYRPI